MKTSSMIRIAPFLLSLALSGCTPEQKVMGETLSEGTPVFRSSDPLRSCRDGSVDMGKLGRVVYLPVPLSLPAKPEVPKIKGKDLKCLSPSTQWELKNRDTILKDYISELETIIRSTQK